MLELTVVDSAPGVLSLQPDQQIDAFAEMVARAGGQLVEIETRHHFAPGLYGREMRVQAGQTVLGAEHLTEHLCSFAGDMTIYTRGGCTRLVGHHVLTSHIGAQRLGIANAESVFVTWHPNPDDCRDLKVLEQRFVKHPELLQHNRTMLEAA